MSCLIWSSTILRFLLNTKLPWNLATPLWQLQCVLRNQVQNEPKIPIQMTPQNLAKQKWLARFLPFDHQLWVSCWNIQFHGWLCNHKELIGPNLILNRWDFTVLEMTTYWQEKLWLNWVLNLANYSSNFSMKAIAFFSTVYSLFCPNVAASESVTTMLTGYIHWSTNTLISLPETVDIDLRN